MCMKKILTVLTIVFSAGICLAQRTTDYYTPVVNKEDLKHHPRERAGLLKGELSKSDASRIRSEYRQVRKAEVRAKHEAAATNRERAKENRRQDKRSWSAYRQKHDRYGRIKS